MDTNQRQSRSGTKIVAITAMALGLAGGSYGIASAATGSGAATTVTPSSTAVALPTLSQQSPASSSNAQQAWGGQRSDETVLTGETAAKVETAAVAKLSGATVVRTETDADGNAAYEVHMVKADGTPATVYVDKQFAVVSVETR